MKQKSLFFALLLCLTLHTTYTNAAEKASELLSYKNPELAAETLRLIEELNALTKQFDSTPESERAEGNQILSKMNKKKHELTEALFKHLEAEGLLR